MANVNTTSSFNGIEFYNMVSNIVEEIERHLSEATKMYFKHERYLDDFYSTRMDNMGADNFSGNADFYTLMGAIHFNEKKDAQKAFKCASDYLTECFNKVDAYKPCGGICSWTGINADLWLPLYQATSILNEKLKPIMEEYFQKA